MLLYHASNVVVENPRIMNRFKTLDFGTGFYTTSNESQAREFAKKVHLRRKREGSPIVNVYRFDETGIPLLKTLTFSSPDKEWLEFVVHNRREGRDPSLGLDLVIGPVANDDVFQTVALYESGMVSLEDAIRRFKVKELFNQYLFCNEAALAHLTFESSYVLSE